VLPGVKNTQLSIRDERPNNTGAGFSAYSNYRMANLRPKIFWPLDRGFLVSSVLSLTLDVNPRVVPDPPTVQAAAAD
jgi:hypothetical protein